MDKLTLTTKQRMDGIVPDLITGRPVQGFIPNPSIPGGYLCNANGCRKPTGHHNYAVCWQHTPDCFRERRAAVEHAFTYDREFLAALKIADAPRVSSGCVSIEIVMQGDSVRKARELHAARKRKPMMGERRASWCGQLDLGDIS